MVSQLHQIIEEVLYTGNTAFSTYLVVEPSRDEFAIGRLHARDQTSSKCAFEKRADRFQYFCNELNSSDIIFCKSSE